MHPDFASLPVFPNLKAIFSRSAGVESLYEGNRGIFCARTLGMMPRGAMPVNVGRGKHMVDEDLIKALDSGQLSWAALDGLWPEPLPSGKPTGALDRTGHASRSGRRRNRPFAEIEEFDGHDAVQT